MNSLSLNQTATMSSTEIAELTGKNHKEVLRDIRKILDEVGIDSAQFCAQYKDSTGRLLPVFNLPRRECDLVIAGYSAKYRLAIIDRWQELEQKNQITLPNFADPAAAAIAWAEQFRIAQAAIATKAEIGSRREATAMNTAAQAVKKINSLQVQLDKSKDYSTIKRMELLHGIKFNWRLLKDAATNLGIASVDVFDANYGTVKAYHRDVWMEAYALDISEAAA
ncbi:MAG: Rha family transcriptional regulator [Methylobacter sp.]